MVLFNFKAAFPSVNHEFMWEVLKGIGLGDRWINLIKCFYLENRQFVGKAAEESFVAEVGIRQGCPLSPLILRWWLTSFCVPSNKKAWRFVLYQGVCR